MNLNLNFCFFFFAFTAIFLAICCVILHTSGINGQQEKWSWASNNRNNVGAQRDNRKYEQLEDFR